MIHNLFVKIEYVVVGSFTILFQLNIEVNLYDCN